MGEVAFTQPAPLRAFKMPPVRTLVFDTECRPMHYSEWRPESQITAYAWSWADESEVHARVLDPDLSNEQQNLLDFLEAYIEADLVVGHYIRKHDLPLLNDHCVRFRMGPLPAKLTTDTKLDFVKVRALGLSQENLAHEFDLAESKHSMSGALWRQANALDPVGAHNARTRVVSDVRQSKALRLRLLEARVLKAPKVWSP
jgi:hypothetical protein